MTDRQKLMEQLILHEGNRLKPYVDTVGKITIGIGRNLTDKGISEAESALLCEHDIADVEHDLAPYPWLAALDQVRRRVVEDMMFNLGPSRFAGFKALIHALAIGDTSWAADEMLASLWAKQTKTRAERLARMMRSGFDEIHG